jgi:protein-disulfide isomerase
MSREPRGGSRVPPVTDQDHVQGGPGTVVTMIEYGDFECPHCGRAYPVLKRVKARLGERLRFVYRHFPLADVHPHAEHAAEASESAGARGGAGAFWAMHDQIFEHQDALDDASLASYAMQAGVDGSAVLSDLAEGRYRQRIRDSFRSGARAGVNGTPTLFIEGIRYDGSPDEASLVAVLERAVVAAGVGP